VWAENGYTAQLNRGDTLPFRLSPGHVSLPGLRKLTNAPDFFERLDLYNGEIVEQGGGMTATTYVDDSLDVMVIDVKGADPNESQTASIELWAPREPNVLTSKQVGVLAETWRDTNEMGASGLTYGAMSAFTAEGRGLQVERAGPLAVRLTFRPNSDGTFRILVCSPEWRGGNDALSVVSGLLEVAKGRTATEHRKWWNGFWNSVGVIKLTSLDGSAEYFESLRMIDLFTTAAESRDRLPGSQAGIGDLFSSFKDDHHWGPSAYWHWNLRMQVSANLGAGMATYNDPYFNLYNDNLDAIAHWTREHMGGRPGVCIPETMRFNGTGYENETWLKSPGINCSADSRPYYNARTISTGAEVALWVWQQYEYTDSKEFLESHFPLMRSAVQFLLAYAKRDRNGQILTYPSNAHESSWDVHNPTTDVSAMHALFPAFLKAASELKIEDDTVRKVRAVIPVLPPLPVYLPGESVLMAKGDARISKAIIANSYDPDALIHNQENLGLEPVWPYSLIGDDGPLHELGVRTYLQRPNKAEADWSADPVQAARLGLGDEMRSALLKITQRYQIYPSGLAQLTDFPEFYVEQVGVVADAIQSGLVQDYDGTVRIKAAWPNDWDADGTVFIRHRTKVHLQIRRGQLTTLALEAAKSTEITMRSPWPGHEVKVLGSDGKIILAASKSTKHFTLQLSPGRPYLLVSDEVHDLPFESVSGTRAEKPKKLGTRTIGLE
jgi:hypothetical protein